jgi:hypothetical protein
MNLDFLLALVEELTAVTRDVNQQPSTNEPRTSRGDVPSLRSM